MKIFPHYFRFLYHSSQWYRVRFFSHCFNKLGDSKVMPNVVCAVKQYNQVLCIGKAQHHRKSIEIERLARIKKEREKQHFGMLIGTRIQYLILYTEHFNFLCVNFYVWNFSASHSIRSFDLASSLLIHLHTAIRFHRKQK